MAGAWTLCAWTAVPQVAQAAPTSSNTPATISFAGTAEDGTALTLSAQVTDVTVSHLRPGDPSASPGPGSEFLSCLLYTSRCV